MPEKISRVSNVWNIFPPGNFPIGPLGLERDVGGLMTGDDLEFFNTHFPPAGDGTIDTETLDFGAEI